MNPFHKIDVYIAAYDISILKINRGIYYDKIQEKKFLHTLFTCIHDSKKDKIMCYTNANNQHPDRNIIIEKVPK